MKVTSKYTIKQKTLQQQRNVLDTCNEKDTLQDIYLDIKDNYVDSIQNNFNL